MTGAPVTDLAARTWPDVGAPGLLVPLGSTEQHGPHLPLDTDTAIARAVAAGAAARIDGAVVAPALAYGASGEHAGFAGTMSIGLDGLRLVVLEIARSVRDWAPWVVFVNGHGGNIGALASAVAQLRDEGHSAGWIACGVPSGDAHAGRSETSLMLHLRPSDVDLAAAVAGDSRPLVEILPQLYEGGVRAVSASGVLGDPAGASAEEGRAQLAGLVDDVARRVRAFVGGSPPDRHGRLTAVRRPEGEAHGGDP